MSSLLQPCWGPTVPVPMAETSRSTASSSRLGSPNLHVSMELKSPFQVNRRGEAGEKHEESQGRQGRQGRGTGEVRER